MLRRLQKTAMVTDLATAAEHTAPKKCDEEQLKPCLPEADTAQKPQKIKVLPNSSGQILSKHQRIAVGVVECRGLDHALDDIRLAIKFDFCLLQFLPR